MRDTTKVSVFTVEEIESTRLNEFTRIHKIKCGWPVSVMFTQMSIGVIVDVTCTKCKETQDISDYESW